MRNENDNVKTYEVQQSIDLLSIEKGTKLRYQHSISEDKVFFLYEGTNNINHHWFLPLSLVESRTGIFKLIPNTIVIDENNKTQIFDEIGEHIGSQG